MTCTEHAKRLSPGSVQPLPTQRRRTAAIAALCLVGQLCGLAHLLVVQHVACAAHGEMVHVRTVSRPVRAADASRPSDAHAHVLAPTGGRSLLADDHEHCAGLSDVRDAPAGHAQILVARIVQPLAPHAVRPDRTTVSTRPLFRLAPKVSPPLLA